MKIFFAAPFTGKIDPHTLVVEESFRAWLEMMISTLEINGHAVVNAHIREAWGEQLQTPEVALKNDFNSIESSDLLVAYLDETLSPGMHLEFGFAAAFRKPIIIVRHEDVGIPYLTRGLESWTLVIEIKYSSRDQVLRLLTREVEAVRQAIGAPTTAQLE